MRFIPDEKNHYKFTSNITILSRQESSVSVDSTQYCILLPSTDSTRGFNRSYLINLNVLLQHFSIDTNNVMFRCCRHLSIDLPDLIPAGMHRNIRILSHPVTHNKPTTFLTKNYHVCQANPFVADAMFTEISGKGHSIASEHHHGNTPCHFCNFHLITRAIMSNRPCHAEFANPYFKSRSI